MIELIQHKINSTDLSGGFNKLPEITLSMNKDIINKDLERLKNELNTTNNKYNKANLKGLINYLSRLLKSINDESKLEYCWSIDNETDLPYTYPLTLINEPIYQVNTCHYIELDAGEQMIEIDLTDLANLIAFEFMYKDLGETHDTIEEVLKDCGIIGFEKADLLLDIFKDNGDNVFELSKTMLIDESPYKSFETRTIGDYFNTKQFKSNAYREVVDYSCRYANTAIANSIIKDYLHKDKSIKVLAVGATSITLVTNSDSEVDIDEISIRIFGRRFLIEPNVTVL